MAKHTDYTGPRRRKRKLIDPGLQLRISFWFAGLSAVGLFLQFLLFTGLMSELALELPGDANANFERFTERLVKALWISLALILPVTVVLGIVQTFKIAGPLYRMTQFLRELRDGKAPADCRIREGDQLQDFCELLNEATAPLREREAAGDEQRAA